MSNLMAKNIKISPVYGEYLGSKWKGLNKAIQDKVVPVHLRKVKVIKKNKVSPVLV
jgi:hypothetical protein